jgi:hypothetical protein
MKNFSIATAGAALIILGTVCNAQATVVTFDDLPILFPNGGPPIPNGYQGLIWDNFYYLNGLNHQIPDSGYVNGTVSGENVAFNSFGGYGLVRDGTFDFNGAYLTAAWRNGLSILVEGFNNGSLLYSKTVVVDITSPTFFTFDFLGIDWLYFTPFGGVDVLVGGGGTSFAMDNFTFNETKSVPEPDSTLGIVIFSTFGINLLRKRQYKQNNLV